MSQSRSLLDLPLELLVAIAVNLPNTCLLALRRTSVRWQRIVDGPEIASLCREQVCDETGVASNILKSDTAVQLLRDVAVVRATTKWLAAAASNHLALCLPAELALASTDFEDRIQDALFPDVLEMYAFLNAYRAVLEDNASATASAWSSIDSAQRLSGIKSLGTVARTIFLTTDLVLEVLQEPGQTFRNVLDPDLSIANEVAVWLLSNLELYRLNDLVRSNQSCERIGSLKKYVCAEIDVRPTLTVE
ncbi:uncharacterized protein AB675_7758 [Cyphellophora attinorum]|uniref:F-box domain-containing protein n=1 Tax=Cyphellophora attinorum TaxID=1664694 RepID=A0A0N1HA13_9EURO|nr:uncharacterized protein AB675_7758 [Phialophora attinorum]KPI40537.1 hypothetical protein AB675_7758 [Phialophora attinorum]